MQILHHLLNNLGTAKVCVQMCALNMTPHGGEIMCGTDVYRPMKENYLEFVCIFIFPVLN